MRDVMRLATMLLLLTGGASAAHAAGTTVTGYVSSATYNGRVANLQNIKVSLTRPPDLKPLGSVMLDTSNPNCVTIACPWRIDDVDLSEVKAGLTILVTDTRTEGATWAPTLTGTASQETIRNTLREHKPLDNQFAFVVNQKGLDTLAKITGKATGAEVLEQGAFAGVVLASKSETNPSTGFPPFVRGATVTVPPSVQVWYPTKHFAGVDSSVTDTGIFVAMARKPGPATGTFVVSPPSGDKHTWPATAPMTIPPKLILMVIFQAKG